MTISKFICLLSQWWGSELFPRFAAANSLARSIPVHVHEFACTEMKMLGQKDKLCCFFFFFDPPVSASRVPLIPVLRSQTGESPWVQGKSKLHSNFQTTLDHSWLQKIDLKASCMLRNTTLWTYVPRHFMNLFWDKILISSLGWPQTHDFLILASWISGITYKPRP